MRKFNCFLTATAVAASLAVFTSVSYGKPEFTKTEKVKCVACHTKGKELNKVGECYKTSKNLKECQEKK
jgi:hypothetical protein